MRQARSLDTFLDSADQLAALKAHATRLVRLQRIYRDIAPAQLAESSRVANYKQGKLVIHADNGTVAAKLRQLLPSLCDEFSKRACEVTEIQVRAQPSDFEPRAKKLPLDRSVGAHARAKLGELAEGMPESSPLKAALKRLVQRSR